MAEQRGSFFGRYKWYLIILGGLLFYMFSKQNSESAGSSSETGLQEITVIDTTIVSEDRNYRRRSGISTAVHYGLLGYWMGRPMGSGIRRSAYASSDSYNRSQTGKTRMSNTARSRSVRTPRPSSTGKSGYGAGKSTRSYGG